MPESTPSKRLPEIRSLTAVRFYAALAVVLFHYGQYAFRDAPDWMRNIVSGGSQGVALFFILSGFILVYVSQSVDMTTANQRRNFYLRRFARIYPVYFLAWLMVGAFFIEGWVRTGTSLPFAAKVVATYGSLSVLLLQGWVPTAASVWNWPGWTLSAEAFFYASFPFALPVFLRMRTATLLLWLLACVTANTVVVEGLSLMSSYPRTIAAGSNFEVTWVEFLGNVPLLHLPQFLAGVVLGVIYTRRKLPVFCVRHHLAILIVTVLAIGAVLSGQHQEYFFHPASILMPLFIALIWTLATSPAGAPNEGSRRRRAADMVVLLGRVSYATYILQGPIARGFGLATGRPLAQQGPWELIVYVLLLLVISVVVYFYFELPLERWIKRRFKGASPATQREPAWGGPGRAGHL